jgi:hypothetical protein
MKQKFITSEGKVVIEKDVLFIKSIDMRLSRSMLGKLMYPLCALILFIVQFFDDSESRYFRMVLWGIVVLINLHIFYEVLFQRSYSSRIPLNKIVSWEVKPGEVELEMKVHLHLRSGRYREIIFRQAEHQYEPFTEFLSQHIAQPQLT